MSLARLVITAVKIDGRQAVRLKGLAAAMVRRGTYV